MFARTQNWWRSLTPETKRYYKLGLFFLLIVLIASISVLSANKNKGFNTAVKKTDENTTYLRSNLHNMSHDARQAQIQHLQNDIARLQGVVAAQNNITTTQLKQDESHLSAKMLKKLRDSRITVNGINPELAQQISSMQKKLDSTTSELAYLRAHPTTVVQQPYTPPSPQVVHEVPSTANSLIIQGSLAPQTTQPNDNVQLALANSNSTSPPSQPKHLMTMNVSSKGLAANKNHIVKVSSKKAIYIPAGSIITGVTLNGLDAPTGPGAQDSQQIVDIRVKKQAILPNGYRSSIKDCDIIASGYGSMDSRRVFLRTNELSCVANNGGIISAPIKGYVVGGDGLVGVRGTMISHQGTRMLKSLMAGLLSGIGGEGNPTMVSPLQVNPGYTQQFQMPNPAMIGYSALSGGISTAAGNISKFYLSEAEAMQPVIQINPGISVSVILEYGAKIHIDGNTKRQLQETNYQVSAQMNHQGGSMPSQQQDIQNGNITGAMPGFGSTPTNVPRYPSQPMSPAMAPSPYMAAPQSPYMAAPASYP